MRLVRPIVLSLALAAPAALAAPIELPLRVPLEPIRQALAERLAATYREGACRQFTLGAPALEALDDRLRIRAPGAARLGVELLGRCQNAAGWSGSIEFTVEPRIDAGGKLRLRVVDSRLSGSGGPLAGLIWDLAKRQVHPGVERFSYDLGTSREALLSLVRDAAPPEQAAAMQAVVSTLQIRQPKLEDGRVVVPVALEIPDAWLVPPPAASISGAPLGEAELEALEKALEPWDAFVLYAVRTLALDNADAALRQRLFTLLLESRYRMVALLSGDEPAGADPLRALFFNTWQELRAVLDTSRYALFVDAGDALAALEQAAPGLGARPSVDGLRQLARSLRPAAGGDPLAHGWQVDGELRQLFDVREPEPLPPATTSWLDFLVRPARADGDALERWVPTRAQLAAYETRVSGLLTKTAAAEAERAPFATPYDAVYRNLVPTTALIESCWRQYVVRSGKVTYLRSPSGSVGLMQVNQHVWRGFYDVRRLRWDTAYNVRAGAQILQRYVRDYAIPYAEKTGNPANAARAAYAVYNAGPRAAGRFAKAEPHPREQRVDQKLWSLYRALAAGGEIDLAACGVKPAGQP